MTVVSYDLNLDEAECYGKYGCFTVFFKIDSEIPVGHPVNLSSNAEVLGTALVAAIQEVYMRLADESVSHGYIYTLVLADKKGQEMKAADAQVSFILTSEQLVCYERYGIVVLPFVTENDLPVGGDIRFTNGGGGIEPGKILAVQKFVPTWYYVFVIAKVSQFTAK